MTQADDKADAKPAKGASIYVNAETMAKVEEYAEPGANKTKIVDELLNQALNGDGTSTSQAPRMSSHMVALHELAALDDVTPMLRAMLVGEVGDTASFGPVLMRLKMLTAALETI